MNCASIRLLLDAWLDRELPDDVRAQLDQHLSTCSACQAILDDLQRLDRQLRAELPAHPDEMKKLVDSTVAAIPPASLAFQPRRWRTVALALVSAAAGFLLAVVLLPALSKNNAATNVATSASQTEAELPIQLALAIGVIEVEEHGVWKPLATGTRLQPGQRLRTQGKSRCELRCKDGSEIRLNNESEIVVHSPRLFYLKQGQVWSTVAAASTPFQIKTDETTVTALGTQFDLNYQLLRTTLSVLEGKTRLDLGGKTTEVSAGQQLQLDNKKGTFSIREPDYALYQATNWVNEILILKGRDNPELVHRINDVMASIGETKMVYLAEDEIRTLGDHCVVPLCRYLQSVRSQHQGARREMAARIIADLAQPRSIGDLIELLADTEPQVRASIARGLSRLTKQDMGVTIPQWQTIDASRQKQTIIQWQQWWKKNQSRYPESGS